MDFAKCSWLALPNVAIGEMISVYNTEQNPLFVAFYCNALLKKPFAERVEGGNVSNLYFDRLIDIGVRFPTITEQEKVAKLIDALNSAITKRQQQLDKLKELKKGYLQQMFPQAGEKVPRVRFKGFSEEWEDRKLGEVADVIMGQSPNSANYTNDPNDNILVQGNADMKDGRVVPRVWTTQITRKASRGDIIISVRAPVGDVGKTDYDIVLGRGVAGIKGNEFTYQLLVKMNSFGYWNGIIQGSTFESINSSDLKEAFIHTPHLSEQTAISDFLRKLDQQINTQKNKLAQMQHLKTAYLKKMFI